MLRFVQSPKNLEKSSNLSARDASAQTREVLQIFVNTVNMLQFAFSASPMKRPLTFRPPYMNCSTRRDSDVREGQEQQSQPQRHQRQPRGDSYEHVATPRCHANPLRSCHQDVELSNVRTDAGTTEASSTVVPVLPPKA